MFRNIFVSLAAFCVIPLAQAKDTYLGLVLDKGGKDDKSFNSAAYIGATRCNKELGIKIKVVESPDDNAFEQLHTRFAQDAKYSVIIGVGFAQKEAVKKVAAKFPKVNFAIIDDVIEASNVKSLVFEEHEGSFLVGAIAALKSKTGKVGFLGGQDSPIIRRFEMGYIAGAKYVNPKIEVFSNYVGVTPDAWKDPSKAKELAIGQYGKGAEVIFTAAGASGLGVFDAAEEKKLLVIGVDSNQNYIKPGFVLTSMLKRVDEAVFQTCKDIVENNFKGGVVKYGLANKGIDFSVDKYNKNLISKDIMQAVNKIKADIIAGKITVPDYYKANDKK